MLIEWTGIAKRLCTSTQIDHGFVGNRERLYHEKIAGRTLGLDDNSGCMAANRSKPIQVNSLARDCGEV